MCSMQATKIDLRSVMNRASCEWVGTVMASLIVLASCLGGCWANCGETGGEMRDNN